MARKMSFSERLKRGHYYEYYPVALVWVITLTTLFIQYISE